MGCQGWDKILMINLISSKKQGVCNNMTNTVSAMLFFIAHNHICRIMSSLTLHWKVKKLVSYAMVGQTKQITLFLPYKSRTILRTIFPNFVGSAKRLYYQPHKNLPYFLEWSLAKPIDFWKLNLFKMAPLKFIYCNVALKTTYSK